MIAEAPGLDRDEGVADIIGQLAHRDHFALIMSAPRDRASLGVDERDVAAGIIDEEVAGVGELGKPMGKDEAAGKKTPDEPDDDRVTQQRAALRRLVTERAW